MPIYQDYHGDSKDSCISSWDRIQISLKCLFPTYEAVLCDSPEEATIQKALDTNLSTIHQSDPEIPFEIHEGEIEAQYSDSTIIEFENGATQISEFTSSTTLYLNPNTHRSQFKSQNVEDEEGWDVRRLYLGSADWNAAVEVQRPPPEPPNLKSSVEELFAMQLPACQNVIEITKNEYGTHSGVEDGAVAKGKVEEYADLVSSREVNQLSPNPPDLPSHARVIGGAEDTADLNRSGNTKEEEVVALTNRGGGADDDGTMRSAEVGVSAEDNRATELLTGVAKVRSSGLVRRTPSLVAKPPPLLATVLPWDRERRSNTEKKSDGGWVADQAFNGGADSTVFPDVQALEGHNVLSGICRRLCMAKQKQHVTAEQVQCITSIRRQQNMVLHVRIILYLEVAGLYQVARLNDHWFKVDELLDVAYQFGLPVDGEAVSGCLTDFQIFMKEQGGRPTWVCFQALFGELSSQQNIEGFTINYSWFQERFRVLPHDVGDSVVWG
ncbi:hypothetical protein PIB30_026386 [Stylosanthes scabra]|uniref:Uncharacterized protein n=1 Tax=Stylosanthes scabra TaxID=79078 RepID=A0ABU6RAP1_9FABA|nr:hypothetical protein [Stylosanthes scabra]